MSASLDARLAAEMIAMLREKGAGSPGAEAMIDVLSKALPPGAAPVVATPSFGQRLRDAASYLISGVTPLTWFGPLQPIRPQADKPEQGTRGRRFDYQPGINIQYQPKSEFSGGGVPFWVLRGLAENYDLLRLVIETRKDQLAAYDWSIVPKDGDADSPVEKAQIEKATAFFKRPSPEHGWSEWLRAVVEDMLVCDGIALYPRMNRGGELHSLIPIDVATVKRLIDDVGMTPEPPSPAFQQILHGVPTVDYAAPEVATALADGKGPDLGLFTTAQLLYWMRNPRTWKLYGYSPVEQIIITVNIALRRQAFQLEYYTEGSIPDAILGVPETWTPEQIKEFQDQFDSVLAGQTATRRRIKFMPEIKGVLTPKDSAVILKDEFDEWLARLVCFAFSISPSALQKMVNRASGEQIQETAKEEGLMPLLSWLAEKLTGIANQFLGCPDVAFKFKTEKEADPKIAAEIRKSDVSAGIISVDEARKQIGAEPRGVDDLIVLTASGPVPLAETVEAAREKALNPPPPPPAFTGGPGAPPKGEPSGGGGGSSPPKDGDGEKGDAPWSLRRLVRGRRDPETGELVAEVLEVGRPGEVAKAFNARDGERTPIVVNANVHVPPSDTFVNVEPTVVHLDQRSGVAAKTVSKTISAKRDEKTGDLFGEMIERHEPAPPGAEAAGLAKSYRVPRRRSS